MATTFYEPVETRNKVSVQVRIGSNTIVGKIEDITPAGMVVLAPLSTTTPLKSVPRFNVMLSFKLAPGFEFKTLLGSILSTRPVGGGQVRLGIQLIPFFEEACLIKEYLSRKKGDSGRVTGARIAV